MINRKDALVKIMKVNILSTPSDGSCGIGLYTDILINEILKHHNVQISHIAIERWKKNPIYFIRKANEVSRDCDIAHIQFEYDFFGKTPITSCYTPLFYLTLKLLSRFRGFRVVTTMHNTWQTKNPPKMGRLGSIYTFIINRFVTKCSDALIPLSKTIEDRLIEEKVSKSKIHLIPHGTKEPKFMSKQDCKKKLDIVPENKLVTIFGYSRLDDDVDVKGHDLFMKIAKEFSEEEGVDFLVAGEGQTEKETQYLDKLAQAGNKVKLYGYVRDEDIPVVLNATDVMLLPYRKITVSGILNFSLAYQIPTITSNLDYFKEVENGWGCIQVVEPNVKSLSEAVRSLLYNREEQKRLRKACQQYYGEHNYKNVANKIYKVYNSV